MDVSVIVPVYNDPSGIEGTLRSMTAQSYNPNKYEVIAVDNGSSDETPAVIKHYANEYPEIVVAEQETEVQGSYAARNTGISKSSGEIIVFVDADVIVPEETVEMIVEKFSTTHCDYLGLDIAVTIPETEQGLIARYNKARAFPVEFYLTHHDFAPTCGLAIKRSIIEDVGRFDQRVTSGGDSEFGKRVAKAGYTQCFAPEIELSHPARTTFSEILSKGVRLGEGRAQLRQNHGESSLKLKDILPPHPVKYWKRLSKKKPIIMFVVFYILETIMKTCKLKGIIKEGVKHRFGSSR
ncbi:glycosyltransferase [Natronococcus occultus]|nr:glycosyltransferase [Natronococcus occultus]